MEKILCNKSSSSASLTIGSNSRIVIVGTSGSGKSTLARKISRKTGLKDIELDALFWNKNWIESSNEEFREKIQRSIENETGFIIHGNYNKVRDITWGNSDTIIWLNYSRFTVMVRIIKRTIKRILRKEELWNGNIETIKNSLLSKDSIIRWSWKTYSIRKKQYKAVNHDNSYGIKRMIVIKRPCDTKYLSYVCNMDSI